MQIAFICRYGHQDVRRILGDRPLTELDLQLFAAAIQTHYDAEVTPRKELGIPNPEG